MPQHPEHHLTKVFRGATAITVTTRGLHGLTGQRKVAGVKIKDSSGDDLPEEFFHASRRKLESNELLNKITTTLSHLKQVRNDAGFEFASEMGIWIIPNHRVPDVLGKMRELRDELYELWKTFVTQHYHEAVANAKEKLGKRFRERDYPSADRLLHGFEVRIKVVELSVPDTLKKLDAIAYKEQIEQAQTEFAEFQGFARHALREELASVLERIIKATNPGIDGKKGIVRTTVLEKFNLLYQRVKELAFLAEEQGELFCPNGHEISAEMAAGVDAETTDDELPECPHCGVQIARKTVLNYAHRIKRAMEGIGVNLDNVNKGTAALKEMHVRILLNKEMTALAAEAEATMELQSSARFIKRRKSKSGEAPEAESDAA